MRLKKGVLNWGAGLQGYSILHLAYLCFLQLSCQLPCFDLLLTCC